MTPLLTIEQYRTLTNSSSGNTDTLISTLISAASVQIEAYCDRPFWQNLYVYWIGCDSSCCTWNYNWSCGGAKIFPKAKPIQAVVYTGEQATALTITNNQATPLVFSIGDEGLRVTSGLTYSSASSLNTNFQTILNTLTSSYSVDVAIDTSVTDNGLLLKPGSYTVKPGTSVKVPGAKQTDPDVKIVGNEIIWSQGNGAIVWLAGYTAIPQDLQLICANIVQDILRVQTATIKNNLKSETITNYSYTLADVDWFSIINNYAAQLAFYKNVIF